MPEPSAGSRVVHVNRRIGAPAERSRKRAVSKKLSDYPAVAAAHLDVARKLSNPLLLGPPICDELIALVEHTFTEEEARLVRRLKVTPGRTAQEVARSERRPVEEVEPVLRRLALEKRAIGCAGSPEKRRYKLLPVMPGIYEMVLIGESPDSLSAWHRRFAELFEALFQTGYLTDYRGQSSPLFRFLPVSRAIGGHPMALPSDRLEVVLDRFRSFGVGRCQCRLSKGIVRQGCGKPLEVCTAMGQWAERGISGGWLRRVSKQNVLEIKQEAEAHGLVTWLINVDSPKSQASCSCCGCCCKAMRMVSEHSAPGLMAPPHFLPRVDLSACDHCARCSKACPTGAIAVDVRQKTRRHDGARCVGCGLCKLACDRRQAIRMETAPDYRLPYNSWFALLVRNAPGILKNAWAVWRTR